MCTTTFFCPTCQRHKPIAARSNRKSSNSYLCNSCEERVSKLTNSKVITTRDGQEFVIKGRHVQAARINVVNNRPPEVLKRFEEHLMARL